MMNKLALATLAAIGATALAACNGEPDSRPNPGGQPQAGQSAPGQIRPGAAVGDDAPRATPATFETADANKDGKVNREEASSVTGLNFTSADADKDEALTREEFVTAMTNARPRG